MIYTFISLRRRNKNKTMKFFLLSTIRYLFVYFILHKYIYSLVHICIYRSICSISISSYCLYVCILYQCRFTQMPIICIIIFLKFCLFLFLAIFVFIIVFYFYFFIFFSLTKIVHKIVFSFQ